MYVCNWISKCTHTCVHVGMYVIVLVSVHTHASTYTTWSNADHLKRRACLLNVHTHIYTHVYMQIHTYDIDMHTPGYPKGCPCLPSSTNIHTCTYIYMYTCIWYRHAHTWIPKRMPMSAQFPMIASMIMAIQSIMGIGPVSCMYVCMYVCVYVNVMYIYVCACLCLCLSWPLQSGASYAQASLCMYQWLWYLLYIQTHVHVCIFWRLAVYECMKKLEDRVLTEI
jgi:hypothetical protein